MDATLLLDTSLDWRKFSTIQQVVDSLATRKNGMINNEFLLCALVLIGVLLMILKLKDRSRRKSRILSPKFLETFSKLPSLPIIGPAHHVYFNRYDLGSLLIKWRKEYGSCWRAKAMGIEVLLIQDPELLKPILQSGDIGHLQKFSYFYQDMILGAASNGLLAGPAKEWVPRRKTLNHAFSQDALKSYIAIFTKYANELSQELMCDELNSNKSGSLSYDALIHIKTLKMIGEVATGVPLNQTLGSLGEKEFYESLKTYTKIVSTRYLIKPWQRIPFVWYFHSSKRKLDRALYGGIESNIRKIQKMHTPQPDSIFFLDMMMNANWSDDQILSDMVTLFVGGHETVSTSLVYLLWMLALEPEHQMGCQVEVDQLFDSLENVGEEVTLSSLSEFKYLERCVKENLRLFPILPFGTGRELKSPLKLNRDLTLEPGTVVTFSIYALHMDPTIYPDPEKFDPDRFLPENVKSRHAYSYLPFSSGRRNCIGWKMALLEMTVLCAYILRKFNLKTTDKRDDIKMLFGFTLYRSREPNIIFEKRR